MKSIILSIVYVFLFLLWTPGIFIRLPKQGSKYKVALYHSFGFGISCYSIHYIMHHYFPTIEGNQLDDIKDELDSQFTDPSHNIVKLVNYGQQISTDTNQILANDVELANDVKKIISNDKQISSNTNQLLNSDSQIAGNTTQILNNTTQILDNTNQVITALNKVNPFIDKYTALYGNLVK